MTESLRVIFEKPKTEWTEDDQKEVEQAVQAFQKEIVEVCRKHGMEYRATVKPDLEVIALKE